MTKNNIRPFIAWQAALKTKELRSFVPVADICYIWYRMSMSSSETEKSLNKMILDVMANDVTELQYVPKSQVYIQGASDTSDVCDFFGNSGYLAYPDENQDPLSHKSDQYYTAIMDTIIRFNEPTPYLVDDGEVITYLEEGEAETYEVDNVTIRSAYTVLERDGAYIDLDKLINRLKVRGYTDYPLVFNSVVNESLEKLIIDADSNFTYLAAIPALVNRLKRDDHIHRLWDESECKPKRFKLNLVQYLIPIYSLKYDDKDDKGWLWSLLIVVLPKSQRNQAKIDFLPVLKKAIELLWSTGDIDRHWKGKGCADQERAKVIQDLIIATQGSCTFGEAKRVLKVISPNKLQSAVKRSNDIWNSYQQEVQALKILLPE